MAPKLYTSDLSPAARSVLLTAKAIELELELKNVSIKDGENLKPEYLKMNSQHTVPTLDDNGYYLWDSHAINIYLATKYAKNDSLYPKDEQTKGIVNQRLFFSASVMETRMGNIFRPIFYDGVRTIPQDKADAIREVYDFLEKFLEDHDFIAGDSLTIADFSIVSRLSSIEPFVSVTQTRNPLLFTWFQKMQDLPYYVELNKIDTFLSHIVGIGVGAGAHRLWCHRTYKAKLPLRAIIMLFYTVAGHNPLFYWVRDHRVHHRFTDTDADPHNSKRGFFFSHVGWLFMKKHPDVIRKGKEVDMSDLWEDPVIRFHQKYFIPLTLCFGFIIPTIVPPLVWGQDWYWSIITGLVGRYVLTLNFTWFVNSAAHMWGTKPFDSSISPTENIAVSCLTLGEGWHNYHHTFPWDYKAAELNYAGYNGSTLMINFFAKMGWAYDLKSASPELIKKVALKSGDGSHFVWGKEVPESAEEEIRKEAKQK